MKRVYCLCNELRSFELKEQPFVCQVLNIFKNNKLSDIEIEPLKKELDYENVTAINSFPTVNTVLEWRVERPVVEENVHNQSVLVEGHSEDM